MYHYKITAKDGTVLKVGTCFDGLDCYNEAKLLGGTFDIISSLEYKNLQAATQQQD